MKLLAVLLAIVGVALANDVTSYEGYKVYTLTASEENLPVLQQYADKQGYDFWSRYTVAGSPITIMVEPSKQQSFINIMNIHGIEHRTIIQNAQVTFDAERMRQISAAPSGDGRISFTAYQRHTAINAYLAELATRFPSKVTVETIGKSTEGRDMNVIKISSNPGANNPVVFIDGGIHAREWIAPAMALYVIQEVVENSANSNLLEGVDWHILPVMNPDGYEFSHTNTRMWRKTRSTVASTTCPGVDGNRNFNHHWSEGGTSNSPCSDIFHGPNAFSEPETQNLRDYLEANKANIKLYLTIHSYGEYLLYPWSYTTDLPDNWRELDGLAQAADSAQVAAGGNSYTIGQSTVLFGKTAGSADDWAMGGTGIPMAYTIEMPGGGSGGFDLPASQILSTVTPFFEAFKVFGTYIKNK